MSNKKQERLLLEQIADDIIKRPVGAPKHEAWLPALLLQCQLDVEDYEDKELDDLMKRFDKVTKKDVQQRVPKRTVVKRPSSLKEMFPRRCYSVNIHKPNGTVKKATMSWTYWFWSDHYDLTVVYNEGYTRVYSLKKNNPIFLLNLEKGYYQVNFDRPKNWKQLFGCYTREFFVMQVKSQSGNSM